MTGRVAEQPLVLWSWYQREPQEWLLVVLPKLLMQHCLRYPVSDGCDSTPVGCWLGQNSSLAALCLWVSSEQARCQETRLALWQQGRFLPAH